MGCQIALDARHISAADNSSLATWSARRGAAYGATATGTAQPTYKASSINGRPAVQFDGTTDCMDFDAGALGLQNNAAGMLVIAVAVTDNAAADATQNLVFFSNGLLNSSTRFALRIVQSGTAAANAAARRLDADSVVATLGASGATSTPCVIQGFADWTNNSLSCRVNGGTAVTATYSSGGGSTSATASLAARLGGQATSSARVSGRIAAICVGVPLLNTPLRMRIRQHYGFSFRIATA